MVVKVLRPKQCGHAEGLPDLLHWLHHDSSTNSNEASKRNARENVSFVSSQDDRERFPPNRNARCASAEGAQGPEPKCSRARQKGKIDRGTLTKCCSAARGHAEFKLIFTAAIVIYQ